MVLLCRAFLTTNIIAISKLDYLRQFSVQNIYCSIDIKFKLSLIIVSMQRKLSRSEILVVVK